MIVYIISVYLVYLVIVITTPLLLAGCVLTIETVFKTIIPDYKPYLTWDYVMQPEVEKCINNYFLITTFLPIAIPTYIIAYIIKWINQPEVKQRVKIEHNKANFKSILFKDDYNEHKVDYEIRKENIGKLCKYYDVALEIEPTVGDSWMRAIITPHQDMADYELLEFGDKLEKIWNEVQTD